MRQAQRPPEGALRAPVVNPADKYQDKADSLHKYGQYIMACLPKHVQQFSVWKDELVIYVPPTGVIPVMSFLKYHTAAEYTQISDITAVDFPTRDQRFEVVYNLLSVRYNSRIRVKTYADEARPVPSVTGLFEGALWYEREVYDMFGVFFSGHPDLRRIMTDYGFDGHPLRKDFPLTGYTELRYDEEKKRIVIEPLELTQAFRNFEGGTAAWEPVGLGQDRKPESYMRKFVCGDSPSPVLARRILFSAAPCSPSSHPITTNKMPKRKLSDLDSSSHYGQGLQLTRLFAKFDHGVTLLSRALKTARGFERQKLGRREKTAKAAGNNDTLTRLAEEVQVLKSLDPAQTAQRYLFKQLVKTKRIAEAPVFVQFREKKKLAPEGPRSTAEANVTARLYKSTPVKNVFPDIMAGIKQLLGVDDKPAGGKKQADVSEKKRDAAASTNKQPAAGTGAAEVSGEDSSEEWGGIESGSDAGSEDFSQFDGLLAPGSDDEDGDEAASEDASDGGVDLSAAASNMSISRSPSPAAPPPKKQKAQAAAPVTSTTFLPSLAAGYFSGSESEGEDAEAEQPRRKNRMGQQARRALWEKKYGSGANHVKKQKEQEKRDRSSGWDPRRGAVDPADGKRGRWGGGRGGGRAAGGGRQGQDRQDRGGRPAPPKPQDNKPLHPSWEAAKRAKEQKSMASFQGKKVVFD
ncbi:NADH-ubiquinone oxidoreductase 30.4 kDa subunit, mitochondrial precursor [Aspergillus terreus NIH2624]|uniref:NADH-ubiquinone oxidoreductase 30.4 kDa subunit, mitochondrial n=1 Tax=Aspergillus terreus (strain NIH 2624 / FGSC A1156) TaxID=341663 RepID=Q0CI54_ASPTN|nr:NADH-ubiquinone oxidoreductase 30.4 kDa subunit, mitochondrial precursor [Aspergillus terreus NIH2624]EAU33174.1 NADH-ubiquinone oxidoreductase 30.4 kDa subunit, mitochondrial precursor [Aspergillus terreus NIH2624]